MLVGRVAAAFVAIAGQAAGELGASNTNAFLLFAEEKAVEQARINQMAPYNAYRRAFGQKPAKRWKQVLTFAFTFRVGLSGWGR